MSKSLFHITEERKSIESIVEEMAGELTPEMEQALQINKDELSQKGESYILILEKMHAAIEFNKRYKEKAESNIKRIEKAMERLKNNLYVAAEAFGEFEAGIHKVGLKKNPPAVEIVDESKIDPRFKKVAVTESWDKTEIKKAIKAGEKIEGAELTQKQSLKIS